ncbi:MAG: hypothetical protein ACI4LA_05420 [Emergencia sp.]
MEYVRKTIEVDIGPFEMEELPGVEVCRIAGASLADGNIPSRTRMGVCLFSYLPEGIRSLPPAFVHYYPMEEIALILEGNLDMGYGENVEEDKERHYSTGDIMSYPFGVPCWEKFSPETPFTFFACWMGRMDLYDFHDNGYVTQWRRKEQEGGEG